jgi:hypothetical protein
MDDILEKLKGGHRRSIGRANEVVDGMLDAPALFGTVFQGMLHEDPVISMRAADAVEKITAKHPEYLGPHKTVLLQQVAALGQQEVRWHVAQMIPRLELSPAEQSRAAEILFGYLDDRSRIVQTNAMQALADLAGRDESLRPRVIAAVEELTITGSPAVRNRGRKLLAKLKANNGD